MQTETRFSKQELQMALAGFSGTEHYFLHRIPGGLKMNLTDGSQFIKENTGAYWLFDLILSYQMQLSKFNFQVWKLIRQGNGTFFIQCTDGNNNFLAGQEIAISDFPLDRLEVWLVDNVCLLPSEY